MMALLNHGKFYTINWHLLKRPFEKFRGKRQYQIVDQAIACHRVAQIATYDVVRSDFVDSRCLTIAGKFTIFQFETVL
uniref:Uncharacterized protein n=1 Tax=Romanomermis culicivorax TaxID=13658 RepID=A0A915JIH9_ROMCU